MNDVYDLMKTARHIMIKCKDLTQLNNEYTEHLLKCAKLQANYDKLFQQTLLKLKEDTPMSIIDKIAKGALWEERLVLNTEEALVKSTHSQIESVKVQINALQSINRKLEYLPENN